MAFPGLYSPRGPRCPPRLVLVLAHAWNSISPGRRGDMGQRVMLCHAILFNSWAWCHVIVYGENQCVPYSVAGHVWWWPMKNRTKQEERGFSRENVAWGFTVVASPGVPWGHEAGKPCCAMPCRDRKWMPLVRMGGRWAGRHPSPTRGPTGCGNVPYERCDLERKKASKQTGRKFDKRVTASPWVRWRVI